MTTHDTRLAAREQLSRNAEEASGLALKVKTAEAHRVAAAAHQAILDDVKATGSSYGYGNVTYHADRVRHHAGLAQKLDADPLASITYSPRRLPGMADVARDEQGLLWADVGGKAKGQK